MACEGDSERTRQARLLVELLHQVEVGGTLSERVEQVGRLKALPLRDEALSQTRAACVTAYGRALEAEVLQAEVRAVADGAAAASAGGLTKPAALEAKLAASSDALAEAKAALPACRRLSQTLVESAR